MTHLVIRCAGCSVCCPYQDSVEVAQRMTDGTWAVTYWCRECRP